MLAHMANAPAMRMSFILVILSCCFRVAFQSERATQARGKSCRQWLGRAGSRRLQTGQSRRSRGALPEQILGPIYSPAKGGDTRLPRRLASTGIRQRNICEPSSAYLCANVRAPYQAWHHRDFVITGSVRKAYCRGDEKMGSSRPLRRTKRELNGTSPARRFGFNISKLQYIRHRTDSRLLVARPERGVQYTAGEIMRPAARAFFHQHCSELILCLLCRWGDGAAILAV